MTQVAKCNIFNFLLFSFSCRINMTLNSCSKSTLLFVFDIRERQVTKYRILHYVQSYTNNYDGCADV